MKIAVNKRRNNLPKMLDSGWVEKFFHAPFDEFFNFGKVLTLPAINIRETENKYRLTIAAPGLEKSDLKIECFEGVLSISADKQIGKQEEMGHFTRQEYDFTSWSRSFTLPKHVDAGGIEAKYENGELEILLPKN